MSIPLSWPPVRAVVSAAGARAAAWLLAAGLLVTAAPPATALQSGALQNRGQQTGAPPADESPSDTGAGAAADLPLPRPEEVQSRLDALRSDTTVPDAMREPLVELYTRTLTALAEIAAVESQLPALEAAEETAPERLEAAQQAAELPVEVPELSVDIDSPLEEIRAAKDDAETRLETLRQQVDALRATIRARREEMSSLPQQVADLQATVEELPSAATPLPEGTDPRIAEATRIARQAALSAARAELALANQKLRTYDAESARLPIQLQNLERTVAATENQYRQLSTMLAAQRQEQIQRAIAAFEATYDAAPEEAQQAAATTRDLVRQWPEMLRDAARREAELVALQASASAQRQDLDKTRGLVDTDLATGGGLSQSVGYLLQRKRAALPSSAELAARKRSQSRAVERVQGILTKIDARLDEMPPAPVAGNDAAEDEPALRSAEREVLQQMSVDADSFMLDILIPLGVRRDTYAATIAAYQQLIDEHLLWVRDTAPFRVEHLRSVAAAAAWLVHGDHLRNVGHAWFAGALGQPLLTAAWLIGLLTLLVARPWLARRLSQCGEGASKRSGPGMERTVEGVFFTLLLSFPLSICLALGGWLAGSVTADQSYVAAVASALLTVAALALPLELLRQIVRPCGLGEAHFNWPPLATASIRANLRWAIWIGLPLIFVWRILDAHGDGNVELSVLARLLFSAVMVLTAVLLWRVLHPRRGAAAVLVMRRPDGWAEKLRALWHPAITAIPLVLVVLSLLGYSYSAVQLAFRFYRTIWMLLLSGILAALALRWLMISHRRMAMEQLRQKAEQREQAVGVEGPPINVADADSVDLSEATQQSRRLIDAVLFIAVLLGLYVIWSPVLPALGFLDRFTLWEQKVNGVVTDTITLSNLLLAIPIIAVTFVVVRNAPGLLESTLLQRLPLENAVRYAITTLSSYLLAGIGIITAANTLGVRWDSIQWLIAGLGVGLGFGLQEIFANFISGIILLFEQPIRVGDVVTLDNTSGVISRIRMRATTITNWDRQEYIVPNKDFITGRLVNWTLSDSTNRVVIEVGISYDSDTRRACQVLEEICRDHPLVSKELAPLITFEGFGDSALKVVMRCYLDSLDNRLQTIHELHTAINDRFREEGVEIAFPQQDLHVRSLPPALLAAVNRDSPRHRTVSTVSGESPTQP